jgi:hypothetical protein
VEPSKLLELLDANEATIEDAGVVLHSYTALGDGHGIFEWPAFYQLEVNGIETHRAAEVLAPVAERLALPFTYGRKLGFHAQKVLLVVVARGEAGFEKNGRRFIHTVY